MKEKLIGQLVSLLIGMLSPATLKKAVDGLLDIIEDAVQQSETTVDDAIVLPLVSLVRESFNIPDND